MERNQREGLWPRVALWGRFDVARFGDLLLPRIYELELRRRIPALKLLTYSPLGTEHPIALDGGMTALPFGPWSEDGTRRLAAAADVVVVTGSGVLSLNDEALASDYGLSRSEARHRRLSAVFLEGPGAAAFSAWSAVGVSKPFTQAAAARVRQALSIARLVSVRDNVSRRRLQEAGLDRDLPIVPDPVVFAARVFQPADLARRLEYLRWMGWFPPDGAPVVVQGSAALVPDAGGLAAALAALNRPIVLLDTEPADGGEFAAALGERLPDVYRLPNSVSLIDIVAVLRGARCFVGDSVHAHAATAGLGVPSLVVSHSGLDAALEQLQDAAPAATLPSAVEKALIDLLAETRRERLPGAIEERLDAHFDALAHLADEAFLDGNSCGAGKADRSQERLLRALQDSDRRLEATRLAWESRSAHAVRAKLETIALLDRLEGRLGREADEKEQLRAQLKTSLEKAAGLDLEISAAREELGRLLPELAGLNASREALLENSTALLAEKEVLETRLGAAVGQAAALGKRVESLEARIRSTGAALDAMRAEFDRFVNLRVFRYTALFRKLYAAIRKTLRPSDR